MGLSKNAWTIFQKSPENALIALNNVYNWVKVALIYYTFLTCIQYLNVNLLSINTK